ncbi:Holliday junction resolvase RecU [Thermaerobacter litoralis]
MHPAAHRGAALEAQLAQSLAVYRTRGEALILKIPTAWVPVRDPRSRQDALAEALGLAGRPIRGVRPAGEPAVDFFGVFREASGAWRPVAFDAKSTRRASWPLDHLPPVQARFLEDADRMGIAAGLVLEFVRDGAVVWLPWRAVAAAVARRRAGGRASISRAEAESWGTRLQSGQGVSLDLLAALRLGMDRAAAGERAICLRSATFGERLPDHCHGSAASEGPGHCRRHHP